MAASTNAPMTGGRRTGTEVETEPLRGHLEADILVANHDHGEDGADERCDGSRAGTREAAEQGRGAEAQAHTMAATATTTGRPSRMVSGRLDPRVGTDEEPGAKVP